MHTAQKDTVLGTLRFVSKSDEHQVYGELLPKAMTNQKMKNSPAYKTYLAYATGAAILKKARKFMKHASPSKKRAFVIVEEEEPEPYKKVVPSNKPSRKQSTGVQIRDTHDVSMSKKKPPAKAEISKGIDLQSDVAALEANQLKKVLKRSKQDTRIHQAGGSGDGTGSKPGVPDEPKGKSTDTSEADDEQTETDNIKTSDDEEETQDDECIHTSEDYVPTDDETNDVNEEEHERINEELYSDVNVRLTDVEPANKEKDDEEMTVAGHVNANQEGAGNQVNDDAQATQLSKVPLPSSSISSDYAAKFLNFDNIPPTDTKVPRISSLLTIPVPTTTQATTSTTAVPEFETLVALQLRVTNLENEFQELRNVDNYSTVISMIKSEVPNVVKEFLRTNLDDALYKSIIEDENAIDKGVADQLKKRKPDDADKDKGPSSRSDRGLKRQKTNKDTEPSKKAKEDTSNTDEPPVVNVDPKDWFKKLERPPTPDPEWNEGKSVKNKPTQKWLSDLAKAEKPSRTFDD
ncbi:hypothetical protein Tco_0526682 [Tanacetum coccineum]